VLAAAKLIFEKDAVGVGAPHGDALSRLERKDIAVAVVAAQHEIGTGAGSDHEAARQEKITISR
jgi:hypothetical protein